MTVQLTVCVCAAFTAVQPLPFIPATKLLTSKSRVVPLLYRFICWLQCYLEADSTRFNLFDVSHQRRILVFHYTDVTCLRLVGIGAGIREIITDIDMKPIPDTGLSLIGCLPK